MSLNTAHMEGGVLVHQGEMILLHAPLTVLSFSGSDDLKRYNDVEGNSYLTTHRLIFLTKKSKLDIKSFSFPFCVLSEVDVEQPVFGANHLKGKVRAQPNGNWMGEAKFKIVFKSGGAIEFAQGMMKAIRLARHVMPENPFWSAPPPDYATAQAMPAPAYYYAPAGNCYGWNPPAYNFPAPEAGTIYIMEAPPPYPGLFGPGGGMNQQPQFGNPGFVNNQQFQQPYNPAMAPPPYTANGPQEQAPFGNGYPPQQQAPFGNQNAYPQQQAPFGNGYPPQQQTGYPQPAPYGTTNAYPQQSAAVPPPYQATAPEDPNVKKSN